MLPSRESLLANRISIHLYDSMQSDLGTVFKTLADPSRRGIFEHIVRRGEASVSSLVAGGSISQPAVSQHLRALRDAGLVEERKQGRFILYRPLDRGLAPLTDWLEVYGTFWADRFKQLKEVLREIEP